MNISRFSVANKEEQSNTQFEVYSIESVSQDRLKHKSSLHCHSEHADDRPIPTFLASYDDKSASLISPENISQPIFIDHKNGKLFRNKSKDVEYVRAH